MDCFGNFYSFSVANNFECGLMKESFKRYRLNLSDINSSPYFEIKEIGYGVYVESGNPACRIYTSRRQENYTGEYSFLAITKHREPVQFDRLYLTSSVTSGFIIIIVIVDPNFDLSQLRSDDNVQTINVASGTGDVTVISLGAGIEGYLVGINFQETTASAGAEFVLFDNDSSGQILFHASILSNEGDLVQCKKPFTNAIFIDRISGNTALVLDYVYR